MKKKSNWRRACIQVFLFVAFVAMCGGIVWYRSGAGKGIDALKPLKIATLILSGERLSVDIADTQTLRLKGLSGRSSLSDGHGMWFDFGEPSYPGIWMKDMHFPIDIIWFDADMHVVSFDTDISPDTYPRAFYPDAPAQYVLEVPAGTVDQIAVKTGESAKLEK